MAKEVFASFSKDERKIDLEGIPNHNLKLLLEEFKAIMQQYSKYQSLEGESPKNWSLFAYGKGISKLTVQQRHDLTKHLKTLFECNELYLAEYMFRLSKDDFEKWKNGYNLGLSPTDGIIETLTLAYKKVHAINVIRDLPKVVEMKNLKSKRD